MPLGLALAVIITMLDMINYSFYQIFLVGVFFVATGVKKNARTLVEFTKRFPVYVGMTVVWTVYFSVFHITAPKSGSFAITVFCIVFAGYCVAKEGEESIRGGLEAMWGLLFGLIAISIVNFVLTEFEDQRIFFFFQNTNIEGYAMVAFLCISLMFIVDKRYKVAGTVLAVIGIACTASKGCILVAGLLLICYSIVNCKRAIFTIKNADKKTWFILAGILVLAISAIFVFREKIVEVLGNAFLRMEQMNTDIEHILATSSSATYYSSTNARFFNAILALELYPEGSIVDLILGRGELQQYFYAIKPVMEKLFGITGDGAGPAENTFLSLLHDFGLFSFAFYGTIFISAIVNLIRSQDRTIKKMSVLLISMIMLSMMVDMEYWVNDFFFILIFTGIYLRRIVEAEEESILLPSAISSVGLLAAIYAFRWISPYAETWTYWINVIGGEVGIGWKVSMAILLAIVMLLSLIGIWNFGLVVSGLIKEKKFERINGIIMAVSASSLLMVAVVCYVLTDDARVELMRGIEAEKEILSAISDVSQGRIFADKLPELYYKELGITKRTFLDGDEIAFYDNATVITEASLDSTVFTDHGFLYTPISDETAIYSNDNQVIDALRTRGNRFTGFCTYVYNADVYDGLITGIGNSFIIADGIMVSSGQCTGYLDMHLDSSYVVEDYQVCTIQMFDESSEENKETGERPILAEAVLTRSDFDENGDLHYEFPFSTGGVTAQLIVRMNCKDQLVVKKFSYMHTPDYDVHYQVDNRGNVIRTEYYNLDGTPRKMDGGFFGFEQEYNHDNLAFLTRYFDSDFKPVIISEGFAEIRREFTNNNGVSREEYYDDNGKLIALQGGQAIVVRELDDKNNILSEEYYGPEGERILLNGQFFKYTRVLDGQNHCIQEKYFDIEDNPILISGGYAGYELSYDDSGNVIHCIYLGLDGGPTLNYWGYSICHWNFNDKNQVIREEYYDSNDKKLTVSGGQHAVEFTYDDSGNINSESYYGIDNEPILVNGNCFRIKRIYNENKQNVHEEYYGTDDKPILISGIYFSVDYTYDEIGTMTKKTFKDIEGNVVDEQSVE